MKHSAELQEQAARVIFGTLSVAAGLATINARRLG